MARSLDHGPSNHAAAGPFLKSRRFEEAASSPIAGDETRRSAWSSSAGGCSPQLPPRAFLATAPVPAEVDEGASLLSSPGTGRRSRGLSSFTQHGRLPLPPLQLHWDALDALGPEAKKQKQQYSARVLSCVALTACCFVVLIMVNLVSRRRGDPASASVLQAERRAALVRGSPAISNAAADTEIAVIGCGIAGATTVLELLRQGFRRITVFEHSPSLLNSTSASIAATINLDTTYRDWLHGKAMLSVMDVVRSGFSADVMQEDSNTRWGQFLVNAASRLAGDPRAQIAQKRAVFRKAHKQLTLLVTRFPKLCTALIGQWCCEAGPAARSFLETGAGVKCPTSEDPRESPLGLFQLTGDYKRCAWMEQASSKPVNACDDPTLLTKESCEALGHSWQRVSYEFYNTSETQKRLSAFLSTDSPVLCSIVEHSMTGFARSEILFDVVGQIMREQGVQLGLSCDVTDLVPVAGADGKIQVISQDARTGRCRLSGRRTFDKVVVAASAASVPLLSKVDPRLQDHLIGVKGYGLQGGWGSPLIPKDQSGRGLHFMDESKRFEAAYARATEDLNVKVWGGHTVAREDEELKPPYDFCSHPEEERIFREGPSCASSLVDLPTTQRLSGMRPVPSIGAVPMIKKYTGQWRNIYLNSGFGYNGYDLSWFASLCVGQWLMSDASLDKECQRAIKVGVET